MDERVQQLVEGVRSIAAEVGAAKATIEVGPFEQPATWEQRRAFSRFCNTAYTNGYTIQTEDGPELLHAVVTLTGRA